MLGLISEYLHLWYGKTRVTSYDLRVESLKARVKIQKCEFKSASYELKSTSYEFKSTSYEFKSTSYEFKSSFCEFKFTIYEFQFMSYEFKSTNSRIIKSIKTQVNSLQFFTRNYKNKKWRYQFRVTKEFQTSICGRISFRKI